MTKGIPKTHTLLVVSLLNKNCEKPDSVKSFLEDKLSKNNIKFASPECKSFENLIKNLSPTIIAFEKIGKKTNKVLKLLKQKFPKTDFFSIGEEVDGIPRDKHYGSWETFGRYALAS